MASALEIGGDEPCHGETLTLTHAELTGGEAPSQVLVAPWGHVESTAGDFVVDEESARLVVEAFTSHGTDLPIDFEHQTLGGAYASPHGKAPAAGWITSLTVLPGEGIVANVNWTGEGRRLVETRAYRYLSPVAMVRRNDRKLVALHSAALTNKPAIVGMNAIVHQADTGASAEIEALAAKLACAPATPLGSVALAAAKRIDALEADHARRDAEERVQQAHHAGKLTPALHPWAMTMALEHRALFECWLADAPVIVAAGCTEPPAHPVDVSRGTPRALESAARAEYRAHPELSALTNEEAYVAAALRENG